MPSVAGPTPSRAPVLKALKATEETLLAMNKEIARALAVRNTFVPINLLPTEVFVNILTHLKDSRGGTADVVAASHVCRHWRAVAVGTPQLWTVVPLANLDLVREYLARSGPLPLHLSVGEKGASFCDLAVATEEDMHRVASLNAQFRDLDDLIAFASDFVDPAPALRSLRLAFRMPEDPDGMEEDFQPPPLISSLCPNVTTVSATNMTFPLWASPTSITTLHLHRALPDFISLLKMLSYCPRLQELLIVGVPDPVTWDDLSVELTVDLPLARTINLRVDYMAVALGLLAHLALPDTATVRMEMFYNSLADVVQFRSIPTIPCTEKLSRWTIDWFSTDEVLVSGWMVDGRGPARVQFSIVARTDSCRASLPRLLQCDWPVHMGNITDLTFNLRDRALGSTDVDFFRYYGCWFENLKTLRLRRPTPDAVICLYKALCSFIEVTYDDDPGEYVEVRFPHLEKVEVGDFVWSRRFLGPLQSLVAERGDLIRAGHAAACAVELVDVADCPFDDGRSVYVDHARVSEDGMKILLASER
ncbi:hypothetical protein GY45DRAFT_1326758 [Cubamyces sp. BRFM 1775]|nr:hypothetical protein GY45DRAFT_1326758 [Cubamyces sp. BRFM 1775]